jgi:AGCS family alanine or glycine:cation symporter
MKWMAIIFSIATILSSFGTGSLPQINSIANSMFATFGVEQIVTGAILAVLLGAVIIGGISRIAMVTSRLVPIMAIFYFIGSLAVIAYNIENVIPSLVAVFADVFSGSAATGGFLGATIAYAFNRGVNRGLFSNEAGQGSAPIAHAAARAHEPVSEGMVAILEPFIDTVIICTLTGLVILSSGVWYDKIENQFQSADIEVLAQPYEDLTEEGRAVLFRHITGGPNEKLPLFNGKIQVENGEILNNLSLIHARSLAEEVKVRYNGKELYTGELMVKNGKFVDLYTDNSPIVLTGKSLIHSAPLTTEAFKRSYFGDYGQYIVSIGLLLFAFSTAISWSYYGGRATLFLFGIRGLNPFKVVYIIGFFLASFVDTTIIWTLSGITIALMTLPNLLGILLLHREMKQTVNQYWADFKKEWPGVKTPE